jgi:hypothetical protein
MYVMYYAPMLRCWQLIRILVKTNHPCLRVGCHTDPPRGVWCINLHWFGTQSGLQELGPSDILVVRTQSSLRG